MREYFELLEQWSQINQQWNHLNWATGQAVLELYGFKITY
ncbi:hypothetical protein CPT_Mater189 [Bacillus phage Mater]|uniref:Uncharacterized protein n=1 Tax=Bacillus phage Mater TaxID=1540090 RepID=A0A0A0RS69_9CAUD|nr:hypothetical protein CPT_Mater189 [Bacillus phage Mater]AIW03346.1 hypothetical protein CPT_Mater189 [Bacillus phage Mater]